MENKERLSDWDAVKWKSGIVTVIFALVYVAFWWYGVGLRESKLLLSLVGFFSWFFFVIFAGLLSILREENNRYGNRPIMLVFIIPWFLVPVAPAVSYFLPHIDIISFGIIFILGWGLTLLPLGWLLQNRRLAKRYSTVVTGVVVDNIKEKMEGLSQSDIVPIHANTNLPVFEAMIDGKPQYFVSDDGEMKARRPGETVQIHYDPNDLTIWTLSSKDISMSLYIVVDIFICVGIGLMGFSILHILLGVI